MCRWRMSRRRGERNPVLSDVAAGAIHGEGSGGAEGVLRGATELTGIVTLGYGEIDYWAVLLADRPVSGFNLGCSAGAIAAVRPYRHR